MYERSDTAEGVDDARLEMFSRSCHQAVSKVMLATVFQPDKASSADWVWTKKTEDLLDIPSFYYCGEM